jgi:hypothetical protein
MCFTSKKCCFGHRQPATTAGYNLSGPVYVKFSIVTKRCEAAIQQAGCQIRRISTPISIKLKKLQLRLYGAGYVYDEGERIGVAGERMSASGHHCVQARVFSLHSSAFTHGLPRLCRTSRPALQPQPSGDRRVVRREVMHQGNEAAVCPVSPIPQAR